MYKYLITYLFLLTGIGFSLIARSFDNFNTENGLTDHYITQVYQDKYDWIWIGEGLGLQRFDGVSFKRYGILNSDSSVIYDFLVRDFFEDHTGTLYVGIEELGLIKYNRNKDFFERVSLNNKPIITDESVKCITEDVHKNLWLATKNGLQKIDFTNETIVKFQHNTYNNNSISSNYVREVLIDNNSEIWVGTKCGLDKLDMATNRFIHYSELNTDLGEDILDLFLDKKNRLWVSTTSKGSYIIDSVNIRPFTPVHSFERTNKVNCIIQDKNGLFWIATRGGLFSYNEKTDKLNVYKNDLLNPKSLSHNSVMDLICDNKGDLWIATRAGLSYYIKEKQVFKTYASRPLNSAFLNSNEVYCIWEDANKNVWIGTESGGVNILNHSDGKFKYLTKENSSLTSNCIKSIYSKGDGTIYIGTFDGGLNIYNEHTQEIISYTYKPGAKNGISGNIVWDIYIDDDGLVWLGTDGGLDVFDPDKREFKHIPDFDNFTNGVTWLEGDLNKDIWLGSETTKIYRPGIGVIAEIPEKSRNMFVDNSNNNWLLTTNKGIMLINNEKQAVKQYTKSEGLASNLTYCMLQDREGKLWISTANGLSCFNSKTEKFKNYYRIDGLQDNQFHYGAAFESAEGEMFFGGVSGLTGFYPDKIKESNYIPKIYFTDFKIFNKSIYNYDYGPAVLKDVCTNQNQIKVPFKYNVLSFEFSALNYTNSKQNKYKYKLKGFNAEWIETGNIGKATFTNLSPGNYTLQVISGNKDTWFSNETSIELIIVPPFYKQTWFIIAVALLMMIIFVLLFLYILKKREQQKLIDFEKEKAKKMHELDVFKLRLFTNISHEIKTPLTLIISPLKKILHQKIHDPVLTENLKLIDKNAQHLMNLISQLLDYRKLQDGKLQVELKRGDIVKFIKNTFDSFQSLINDSQLSSYFQSVQPEIICEFDSEKLRKILNNLISNAIRYNKPQGHISCNLSMVIIDNNQFIKIEIIDTGTGIERKNITKIFDPYYSKSNNNNFVSSGIGLTYTKELVELQNGLLKVSSEVDKGSTFTVLLPLLKEEEKENSISIEKKNDVLEYIQSEQFELDQKNKSVLLIIEDNYDVRQYIKTNFCDQYIILEASNGIEGLDIALKSLPDVILSDVMMPELNGFDLCKRIKEDERTSHIPVLLLTALSSQDNIKEGLQTGADDYITKPFDLDIVQTKIENLLMIRKSIIEKFTKDNKEEIPEEVEIETPDEKFLKKAVQIVEDNIDDSELNVDKFSEMLGVSRMQLYRKINALTNMTVKEFINDIRLKRAAEILSQKRTNISDVVYAVGFSDLSYFGKCFKKKYGMSPTAYNKSKIN